MYKPNFCAECGEKITRTRWRFWTSRSFCLNCEGRFRKARLLLPLLVAVALFSIGLAAGRATRQPSPPLIVQRGELPAVTAKTVSDAADADVDAGADSASASAPKPEPKYGPNGTANERPTEPEEVVSICGARAQKGTPCQRRVRGTGRCWQHRGMPAILPQEKLIITGK
jgi:hypothetical protein